MQARKLRNWSLNCGGVIIGAAIVWLAIRSGTAISVWEFLLAMLVMWAAFIATFLTAPHPFSPARLWFWAILFRIAGLFAEPIFEDDWHRYLWDGRTFVVEGNPYENPPADYFLNADIPANFQRVLDNINYPEVPTIYGPVCQYVFGIAYVVAPGELWPLKLLLAVADLAIVFFLLRMTTAKNALLYAWCPLAIFEVAINAHPEVLGVAAAVAGLYAARRGDNKIALVAAALAVGARIHAVLLGPFFVLKAGWQRAWILAVGVACLYLPFWLQGSAADWAGLGAFLQGWEFNSTLFAVAAMFLGTSWAKTICGLAFAVFYGMLLIPFPKKGEPRGDLVYGVFFLLSAVVNPWYLLWVLPFVALRPSVAGLMACAVVSLSYVHGLNLDSAGLAPYQHPWWVRPAEIGAVAVALAFDYRLRLGANRKAG